MEKRKKTKNLTLITYFKTGNQVEKRLHRFGNTIKIKFSEILCLYSIYLLNIYLFIQNLLFSLKLGLEKLTKT